MKQMKQRITWIIVWAFLTMNCTTHKRVCYRRHMAKLPNLNFSVGDFQLWIVESTNCRCQHFLMRRGSFMSGQLGRPSARYVTKITLVRFSGVLVRAVILFVPFQITLPRIWLSAFVTFMPFLSRVRGTFSLVRRTFPLVNFLMVFQLVVASEVFPAFVTWKVFLVDVHWLFVRVQAFCADERLAAKWAFEGPFLMIKFASVDRFVLDKFLPVIYFA